MINRRHIRIKVMQAAYAFMMAENDKLDIQERYLMNSLESLHELYITQLRLLIAVLHLAKERFETAKYSLIPTDSPLITSPNFINNRILLQLENSLNVQDETDRKNLVKWNEHIEIIEIIWKNIYDSTIFESYVSITSPNYKDDLVFIKKIYREIIAPNDNLYQFYEDQVISWADDIPFVNTWIFSNFSRMKSTNTYIIDSLYKDISDKDFALQLFRKTILNFSKYEKDIDKTTPNWDSNRITKIDKLLMVMAIAEFFHFPSIPTKVSINEYIEIAKDYATDKSSFFINGVLDKLLNEYNKVNKIQKIGRGLL